MSLTRLGPRSCLADANCCSKQALETHGLCRLQALAGAVSRKMLKGGGWRVEGEENNDNNGEKVNIE